MNTVQKLKNDRHNELQKMKQEYQAKFIDYLTKRDKLSEPIRKSMESKLQAMVSRIDKFEQETPGVIEEQTAFLLKPIRQKVEKAVEAVAEVGREYGYAYILDQSAVVYNNNSADDITNYVKQKLRK